MNDRSGLDLASVKNVDPVGAELPGAPTLVNTLLRKFDPSVWLLGAVAVVMMLPTLTLGLFADDYMMLGVVEKGDGPMSRWDLFSFSRGDSTQILQDRTAGWWPWWVYPQFKLAFFRPISSALFNFDVEVFGHWYTGYHLHSLLWYGLAVVFTLLVFRLWAPGGVGILAGLLFVMDDSHFVPVAWLANRNSVLSLVGVSLGMWAHTRWRLQGWQPGRFWSVVGLAFGLASGESAAGGIVILGLWELCCGPGTFRQRWQALLPLGAVTLVWVLIYKGGGHGASGSGIYVDPATHPLLWLQIGPARVLGLIGGVVLGTPVDLWSVDDTFPGPLMVGGLISIGMVGVLARGLWPSFTTAERQLLLATGLGVSLCLLPPSSTFPSSRLLMLASVPASLFFALLMAGLWRNRGHLTLPLRVVGGGLILIQLILPLPARAFTWQTMSPFWKGAAERSLAIEVPKGSEVLVVGGHPFVSIYAYAVRGCAGLTRIGDWWILSSSVDATTIKRTSPTTLELIAENRPFLATIFESLLRSPDLPVEMGVPIRLQGFTITPMDPREGLPTRLVVTFDTPPTSPTWTLLTWNGDNLAPTAIPEVGQALSLPRVRLTFSEEGH